MCLPEHDSLCTKTGLSQDIQVKTKAQVLCRPSRPLGMCSDAVDHRATARQMAWLWQNSLITHSLTCISPNFSLEIRSSNLPHTEKPEFLCYFKTRFPSLTSLSIRGSDILLDELNSLIIEDGIRVDCADQRPDASPTSRY
ncbi:unnamed protein product [Somion occarium]|uniref:Uncharacterized protein n=1 Tax=Somion occarium TaxID=3059160 RepID=A0ABP1DFA1_9APHY